MHGEAGTAGLHVHDLAAKPVQPTALEHRGSGEHIGEVLAVQVPAQERLRLGGDAALGAPAQQMVRLLLEDAEPGGAVVQQVPRVAAAVGQAGADHVLPLDHADVDRAAGP